MELLLRKIPMQKVRHAPKRWLELGEFVCGIIFIVLRKELRAKLRGLEVIIQNISNDRNVLCKITHLLQRFLVRQHLIVYTG